MKELIFNDARKVEVQSVAAVDGVMHVRMILTTAEQIKAVFGDAFASSRMILRENYQDVGTYENYIVLKYIKEETGGIWEVEMRQTEADPKARIEALEGAAKTIQESQEQTKESLDSLQLNVDMAVAELSMAIAAAMVPEIPAEEPTVEGGTGNV